MTAPADADAAATRAAALAAARAHLWPPYTAPEVLDGADPLVVTHADGAWLTDADGRRYLDGISSWWAATLGHGHPRLRAALADQASRLIHVGAGGTITPVAAALAAELVAVAPAGLTRVHFSDDGSTAVEAALKIAFQFWQQNGRPARQRFLTLAGAYHGDTLGAASVAGLGGFFDTFAPLLFEVVHAPAPGQDDAHGWAEVTDQLERLIHERAGELAGVIVEPMVQGAAGMRLYPADVLRRVRAATTAVDTFLIADEVFTGYGRTGAMWACDLAGVAPDLLCTAKGFTAGTVPMAATLATARIYDGFRAAGGPVGPRALLHGHTFCGFPLGAAVAREVLSIYRDEAVLAGIPARAERMASAITYLAGVPGVRRPRALGMIGAVDLGDGGYHGARGPALREAARRRGLYLRPLGDVAYLCPPLTIPLPDLTTMLAAFVDAVTEVAS